MQGIQSPVVEEAMKVSADTLPLGPGDCTSWTLEQNLVCTCTNGTARNDLGSLEQLGPQPEATYEPVELTISPTVVTWTLLPLTLVERWLQLQAK